VFYRSKKRYLVSEKKKKGRRVWLTMTPMIRRGYLPRQSDAERDYYPFITKKERRVRNYLRTREKKKVQPSPAASFRSRGTLPRHCPSSLRKKEGGKGFEDIGMARRGKRAMTSNRSVCLFAFFENRSFLLGSGGTTQEKLYSFTTREKGDKYYRLRRRNGYGLKPTPV